MGSPLLACACLRALLESGRDTVAAAVTQPDRPKGRRLQPSPCAVKALAEQSGLQVLTPQDVNSPESVEKIRALAPDLITVAAYGRILRDAVLDLPPLGCINMHASLLPRYRGAAPIQWALANGEETTGVTSMYMSQRMDAGDIIFQQSLAILPGDTAASLHDRIAGLAADVLLETLDAVRAGTAPRIPQRDEDATFAPKLTKADGRIDWTLPALKIHNRVRGFNPWPGVFCVEPRGGSGTLRILRTEVVELPASAEAAAPGEIVDPGRDGPLVRTGVGGLRLIEVQPAGGKVMGGSAYLHGHKLAVGDRFE